MASLRVWIDATVFPPQFNPQGRRFILVDGVKQFVDEDGGYLYFDKGLESPMNPRLYRGVVRVTCILCIEEPGQVERIACGRYVHGRFEAVVMKRLGNGRFVLTLEAKAPNEKLLVRWLHIILSGEDKPKQEYFTAKVQDQLNS